MTHAPFLNDNPPDARRPAGPWAAVWFGLLAVVLGVNLIQINHRITSGHSGDFRHFYYAGRALLRSAVAVPPAAGGPDRRTAAARATQDRTVAVVDNGTDPYTSGNGGYLYPPLIALLYTPVARLSYTAAQRAVLPVNVALVAAGAVLAARALVDRFGAPRWASLWAGVALVAVLADVDKVHNELQMFQTNSLQLALFALGLYWLDRRPWWAGVPLGAILNVKYLSLALIPWLIVRRRPGTAVSTVVSGAFFALLPAVLCGWQNDLHYLHVAFGGLGTMVHHGSGTGGAVEQANVEDIYDLLSCSFTSAGARLSKWMGWPLTAGLAVAGVLCLGIVGVVLWRYARRGVPAFAWPSRTEQSQQPWRAVVGVEYVAVVVATLLFSPQTNTRHLSLAVLLTAAAAALVLGGRPQLPRVRVAVATVVMFLCFVLPPGKAFPRASDLWMAVGGPCWGMLLLLLVTVDAALLQGTLAADVTGPANP